MHAADAWAQHSTPRHIGDPVFESLRRWTKSDKGDPPADLPISMTLNAMDEAGVSTPLISAWSASKNTMIFNDQVVSFVIQSEGRLVGIGSVGITSHAKKKVLFGTNFPMISLARALDALEGFDPSEEARALFLAGNARRVFGL